MAFFTERNVNSYYKVLYPELHDFVKKINDVIEKDFWACLPHFEELIKSNFLSRFFNSEALKISNTFDYDTINQDVSIDLLALKSCSINIAKLTPKTLIGGNRPEVAAFCNDMMFCNLGDGILKATMYTTPNEQKNTIFDRKSKPLYKNSFMQKKHDFVFLHAGKDILKMDDIDGEIHLIYFVSNKSKDLMWHYDAHTLNPLYAASSNTYESRLQNAILMLLHMGENDCIPTLKRLSKSNSHFIRWDAIRAALSINPEASYELLLTAKNDVHPHVASAARNTLNNWDQIINS